MLGKEFRGILLKYTTVPPSGDNEPCVHVVIKHTSDGDVQTLMKHFEKGLDINTNHENFQGPFTYPITWSKIAFDVSDFRPNYYEIEFDEMIFHGRLQKIEVTQKREDGIGSFEYQFHFKKEINDGDSKMAYMYLKHKEENEDGKKELVEYPVLINLVDEPSDSSADSELL